MRLVTFSPRSAPQNTYPGVLQGQGVIDISHLWEQQEQSGDLPRIETPKSILALLEQGNNGLLRVYRFIRSMTYQFEDLPKDLFYPLNSVIFRAPIPKPPSIRDFYAFEQHVKNAFDIRQVPIPEEWYQFPVFYFSNPGAVYGPGDVIPFPSQVRELDYELEIAAVIGKPGINIPSEQAAEFIVGLTIMNDWSARDRQRVETRVRLGPAKAKDFATSLGPALVTLDELTKYATDRPGVYDLHMTARVNDQVTSQGNFKDIYYSFGEILERSSQDCWLYPGDIIGSGTVANGCLLEITRGKGPYLQPGDEVGLEVTGLGVLTNQIGDPISAADDADREDLIHKEK